MTYTCRLCGPLAGILKSLRHVNAILMGRTYSQCVAFIVVLVSIGQVIQYHYTSVDKFSYNLSADKTWDKTLRHFLPNKAYYVKHYLLNLSEEILDTWEHLHNASLKLKGLDLLLNDIKPKSLEDPKLERTPVSYEKFFQQDRTLRDVNCMYMIDGNKTEIKLASKKSKSQPRQNPVSYIQYINKTLDCEAFITERGYVMSSLTHIEAAFPIAFSILMYKDIEQAERLLRAIYRPQNIYCIHVDKKTHSGTYKAMEGIANCFGNVFMTTTRIDVRWGKFSVLRPELMCMEALLQRNKKWKYFINLTGQEFPLRTNHELVRILMAYNGANDIGATLNRTDFKRWKYLPPPPHNMTAFKGPVHIAANRDFVDFALHNQKATDLLTWIRKVRIPDECFFTTLNHNPSLRIRGAYLGYPKTDKPYMARFKIWGHRLPCHGRKVRHVCHFGAGDLPLLATRRELFANKFDWRYEQYARDCLEELHFNRTRDEYLGKTSFDSRYYQELGFVKNKVE